MKMEFRFRLIVCHAILQWAVDNFSGYKMLKVVQLQTICGHCNDLVD